jgi:hypothetical protein
MRFTSPVPSLLAGPARRVRERGAHLLGEYAYFSSFADGWVEHARDYTNMMIDRFGFGPHSEVIELASNDGYLVQWFVKAGVPSLGIEPAANVAAAAEEKGVSTLVRFFGVELAEELTAQGRSPDLPIGNNVLHQVPDLNDSVSEANLLINAGFFALRQEMFDPRRLINFVVGWPRSRRVTSTPARR